MTHLISSPAQFSCTSVGTVGKDLNLSIVSLSQGDKEVRKHLGIKDACKSVIMINERLRPSKD